MLNNPPRHLHTDYAVDDVLKTMDANTMVQSGPYDYVITKERVDEYRNKYGYTQADWMDVGYLLWEDCQEQPDYTCGGRRAISIFINYHTTVEDRFYFGGWLTSLVSTIEVHVYSLSSYRAKGTTLNMFYHTSGTENYVLFDDSSLYRGSPIHVGSFALHYDGSSYPQWHATAPFIYERCVEGPLPHGSNGEPNVIVNQELWMSNTSKGSSGGVSSGHIRVVDTTLLGIYCKNGVEGGDVDYKVMNPGGSGDLTKDVIVLENGEDPKSISDIYPDSTYGSDDPWFDGVYPSGDYPRVPRALNVGDADIIDIYTWSKYFHYNGVTPYYTHCYENPHGQRVAYTTGAGDEAVTHEISHKPLHILADSLVEDKVYELRVHLMHVSGGTTDYTPRPKLNLTFKVAALNTDVNVSAENYGFAVDSDGNSGEPGNFHVCFIPTLKNSGDSSNLLYLARWLYTPTQTKSTGWTTLYVKPTFHLMNNGSEPCYPFMEMGIGKTLFMKHNGYIYILTY